MEVRIDPVTSVTLHRGTRLIRVEVEFLPGVMRQVIASGWYPFDEADEESGIFDGSSLEKIKDAQRELATLWQARLRSFRARHGLTREEAGAIVGAEARSIEHYENGEQTFAHLVEVERLRSITLAIDEYDAKSRNASDRLTSEPSPSFPSAGSERPWRYSSPVSRC